MQEWGGIIIMITSFLHVEQFYYYYKNDNVQHRKMGLRWLNNYLRIMWFNKYDSSILKPYFFMLEGIFLFVLLILLVIKSLINTLCWIYTQIEPSNYSSFLVFKSLHVHLGSNVSESDDCWEEGGGGGLHCNYSICSTYSVNYPNLLLKSCLSRRLRSNLFCVPHSEK